MKKYDLTNYWFAKYYAEDYDFWQYYYEEKLAYYEELIKFQMDQFYYTDNYENEMEQKEKNIGETYYITHQKWDEDCLYSKIIINNFNNNFIDLITDNINDRKYFKVININDILDTFKYYINQLYIYSIDWGIHEELEKEIIDSINNICACIQDYYDENKTLRISLKRLNFIENEICKNDIISIKDGIDNYMNFKKFKNREYYKNKKSANQKRGIPIDVKKEQSNKRKKAIINLIRLGFSNIAIAEQLGITKQAVGKFINKYNLRVNPNY